MKDKFETYAFIPKFLEGGVLGLHAFGYDILTSREISITNLSRV